MRPARISGRCSASVINEVCCHSCLFTPAVGKIAHTRAHKAGQVFARAWEASAYAARARYRAGGRRWRPRCTSRPGWGYWRLLRQFVADHGTSPLPAAVTLPARGGGLVHDTGVIYPFAALALTALLAGVLIAAPRISPLAPGLPGLVLLAWTGLYAFSAARGVPSSRCGSTRSGRLRRPGRNRPPRRGRAGPGRAAVHPVPVAAPSPLPGTERARGAGRGAVGGPGAAHRRLGRHRAHRALPGDDQGRATGPSPD